MLNDKEQQEVSEKLEQLWGILDEFLILKELLELLDEQLNKSEFTSDAREIRMQLLLNCYREGFAKHFDNSRKLLLEVDRYFTKNTAKEHDGQRKEP